MIGLDTTAIIDLLAGNQNLGKIIEKHDMPLISTRANYFEAILGFDSTKKRDRKEEKFFDEVISCIKIFEIDKYSCKRASQIKWELRKKGFNIGSFDCLIAGLLINNGIKKIITRKVKHFEKIEGLEVISY